MERQVKQVQSNLTQTSVRAHTSSLQSSRPYILAWSSEIKNHCPPFRFYQMLLPKVLYNLQLKVFKRGSPSIQPCSSKTLQQESTNGRFKYMQQRHPDLFQSWDPIKKNCISCNVSATFVRPLKCLHLRNS